MEEIKEGDVVWLKSGSPAMTVDYISKSSALGTKCEPYEYNCNCVYFDGSKKESIKVVITSLTKENPNRPSNFSTPTIH